MKKKLKYIDFKILIPYLTLTIIGIIMIFSASSYNLDQLGKNPTSTATKQAMFLIISIGIIAFIYKTKITVYQTPLFQKIMLAVTYSLLIAISVFGLGKNIGGAERWIEVAGFTFQPSEFVMISTIIYMSAMLSKRQNTIQTQFFSSILTPSIIVGMMIMLVAIQPNLGGATITFLLFAILILASGIPVGYTFLSFGGVIAISFIAKRLILFKGGLLIPGKFAHIYNRFVIVSNPFEDRLVNGFQLVNSYFAIYNGGWFGRGLGGSIQKKGFLPVAETDFIFSVTIEELGIIMGILILGLLFYLIIHILRIGIAAKDSFNSLVCIGVSSAIALQLFINLGGILSLIPMTGVPFPFMSYGGSNLITLSVLVGLALNISANERRAAIQSYQLQHSKAIN